MEKINQIDGRDWRKLVYIYDEIEQKDFETIKQKTDYIMSLCDKYHIKYSDLLMCVKIRDQKNYPL